MSLEHYAYHFAHLHTAHYKGRLAPHKAVLMLAVMRLVGEGALSSPEIGLKGKENLLREKDCMRNGKDRKPKGMRVQKMNGKERLKMHRDWRNK